MTYADRTLARCADAAGDFLAGSAGRRPQDAALYLAHVEGETPLRRLADAAGRPVSSVHRAVRRVEALRDDPLVDAAFDALGRRARAALASKDAPGDAPGDAPEDAPKDGSDAVAPEPGGRAAAERIFARALARLAEPESFLIVAQGAARAGVFCRSNRFRRPLSLVTVETAAELAARDFVRCVSRTAVSAKYAITSAGKDWLRRHAPEGAPAPEASPAPGPAPAPLAVRAILSESPIAWLARRRSGEGAGFLTAVEVEAGERLREDHATARPGGLCGRDWRAALDAPPPGSTPEGAAAARRLAEALAALGPGLADVAFRCCCLREGLESIERAMGWSARSGKVVLKIALGRLAAHYGPDAAAR